MSSSGFPPWHKLTVGACIDVPGSARENLTGSWRSARPDWDNSECIKCGVCWMFCPDAAVIERADGYYDVDWDYCKGCAICATECPMACIRMIEEE